MRWMSTGMVVLLMLAPVGAEEEGQAGALTAAEALTLAKQCAGLLGTGRGADAVRTCVDMPRVMASIFAEDLARLDEAERSEAETLLREIVRTRLAGSFEVAETGALSLDVEAVAGGQVGVRVTIPRTGVPPEVKRWVIAKVGQRAAVVDVGPADASLTKRLRETYLRLRRGLPWDVLTFAWTLARRERLPPTIKHPVFHQPARAPYPNWVSRATLSLPIDLPQVFPPQGDDRAVASSTPEGENLWRVIAVTSDGTVLSDPAMEPESWRLSSEDPGLQDDALQALLKSLHKTTADPALRFKDGRSRLRILIYADWRAKWKYIQWVMQACAHPDVKAHRISLAQRRAGVALPAPGVRPKATSAFVRFDTDLPKDTGLAPTSPAETRELRIKIKMFRRSMHDPKSAHTMIKLEQQLKKYFLPRAWRGRALETERLQQYDRVSELILRYVEARIAESGLGVDQVVGEIVAPPPKGGAVPYGDVMAMLSVLRRAGIKRIVYEGAATPLTASERRARAANKR